MVVVSKPHTDMMYVHVHTHVHACLEGHYAYCKSTLQTVEVSCIMSEFENTDRENSHSYSATLAMMGTMLYVSNDVETWTQTSVKRGAMGDRQ